MTSILLTLLFSGLSAHALTNSIAAENLDFESNIMISTSGPDGEGHNIPGFCNATLITNQVMVTAAHCLKDAFVLKDMKMKVYVGAYKYVTKPNGQVVRIGFAYSLKEELNGAFYFTPELKREIQKKGFKANIGPEEDTGVIILEKPLNLKADYRYAEVVSRSELQMVNNSLMKLYPTVVTINFMEEITTNDTKKMAVLNNLSVKQGYYVSKSTSRVKAGDSGSPLYVNIGSKWKLGATAKGEAHNVISSWDVYTAVSTNLCSISAAINDIELGKKLCP